MPEKISGMFIVSRPIRREMKPRKITDKPQNGLIMTCRVVYKSRHPANFAGPIQRKKEDMGNGALIYRF